MASADLSHENVLLKVTSLSETQLRALLESPVQGANSLNDYMELLKDHTNEDLLAEFCKKLGFNYAKDIPVNDIPMSLIRDISINYAKTKEVLPAREEA